VYLHGQERGLDTLLPLAEVNMADVLVHHADTVELQALRDTYSSGWHYGPIPTRLNELEADLIIIDPPTLELTPFVRDRLPSFLGNYSGRLLLAVSGYFLDQLKCDADQPLLFGERLGRLLGKPLTCREIVFRDGDPEDRFWACLEIRRAPPQIKS
jgi:hypothetical protein